MVFFIHRICRAVGSNCKRSFRSIFGVSKFYYKKKLQLKLLCRAGKRANQFSGFNGKLELIYLPGTRIRTFVTYRKEKSARGPIRRDWIPWIHQEPEEAVGKTVGRGRGRNFRFSDWRERKKFRWEGIIASDKSSTGICVRHFKRSRF